MAAGRKPTPIDTAELEKLCALHCTQTDLAAWFHVAQTTIENRVADEKTLYEHDGQELTFRQIMERGYAKGRVSLRRRQMEAADRGNPTMLIWLGKQLLGQKDNLDLKHTGTGPRGELEINGDTALREELSSIFGRIASRTGTK